MNHQRLPHGPLPYDQDWNPRGASISPLDAAIGRLHAADQAPPAWKPMPPKLTPQMEAAAASAARAYLQKTGGNSPTVIYEALRDSAPAAPQLPRPRVTRPADPTESEHHVAAREGYDDGWNECLAQVLRALGIKEDDHA